MSHPATPGVSVVIPYFEQGLYLRRAVASVLRQTFEAFEVIVVDDGSSDGATNCLGGLTDRRVAVYRSDHLGVSAARNRGVSIARAPWVAFLDADDEWSPDFLESTQKPTQVVGGLCAVFTNLRDHKSGRALISRVICDGPIVRDYFAAVLENEGQGMSSSSVLVSRPRLLACGGFPEGVGHGEDVDLWARLAWSGDVAFCDRVAAIYHSEVANSASKQVHSISAYPRILHSYQEWSAKARIRPRLVPSSRRYANWILSRHVMELCHHGLKAKAREHLRLGAWRSRNDPHVWRARVWCWLPTGVLRVGRRLRAALR